MSRDLDHLAIVAPSPVPFTMGGAERAWLGLARAFNDAGIRCELLKLPSPERDLGELVASYRSFLDLDVSHFDAVLTSKYPAWMIDHPSHDIYLFHRLRGLYDTYPPHLPTRIDIGDAHFAALARILRATPNRDDAVDALDLAADLVAAWPDDPALAHPGPVGRELVHYLDRIGFRPGRDRSYFALSNAVAGRRGYFPAGVDVDIVHLPSDLAGLEPTGHEHFFTASRLDGPKRLDLLIDAYRHVPGDIPLLIAGTGPEESVLRHRAAGDDRIQFLGFVSDDELVDHYNRALGVPFLPRDEDWGLIAVEAMRAGAPVITATDSGGPRELVDDGTTGFVVEPTAEALAAAMTRLATEPGLGARLGDAGRLRAQAITWERAIDALTAPRRSRRRPPRGDMSRSTTTHRRRGTVDATAWRTGKPKVVVLSTYGITPAVHGGQLRAWHLYRPLTDGFDVELLCLGSPWETDGDLVLGEGVVERVVSREDDHQLAEQRLLAEVGVDVSDIVAGSLIDLSPDFLAQARRSLADADLVLLAQPYLLEVAERFAPDRPLIYDSYNCEADLKDELLTGRPRRGELVDRVVELEGRATRSAALRTACSALDTERIGDRYDVAGDTFLVMPNGVDATATAFTTGSERRRATATYLDTLARTGAVPVDGHEARRIALFIGSYHPPNLDAARRIVRLAPELPEVVFLMCGDHVRDLPTIGLPDNVLRVGKVSNLVKAQLLRAASLGLNPMVHGSGTNLKLVEYLAAGLPVVSTRFGARGLPVTDGVHAVLTDPESFGRELGEVAAADPASTDPMAAAGRALVEERFDWTQLSATLGAHMEKLLT